MLRGAGLRWRPLHEVQKHRPSRQARPSPSAPAKKSTEFSVLFSFIYAVLRRFYLLFPHRQNYGARSFPYAVFSFSHRFLFTLCHTIHTIRLVHHQKSINHNSNQFVISYYIKPLLYLINLFILCVNSYMPI